jgi:hypothetical protein
MVPLNPCDSCVSPVLLKKLIWIIEEFLRELIAPDVAGIDIFYSNRDLK